MTLIGLLVSYDFSIVSVSLKLTKSVSHPQKDHITYSQSFLTLLMFLFFAPVSVSIANQKITLNRNDSNCVLLKILCVCPS